MSGLIKIQWGKAVLYLTQEEVKEAIRRGKVIKRNLALEKRMKNYGHNLGTGHLNGLIKQRVNNTHGICSPVHNAKGGYSNG